MTFDTRPPGAADPAPSALRTAVGERLLVADGAMGSMLQGCPVTLDDVAGLEGCNEILNVTRPDIVRSIHDRYLDAGVDCITTSTFGANLSNLGEYGIADRIVETCPDLEDRAKVMRLLEPERIGVTLSEEFQLAPEPSTDALITHDPEASYFST